MEKKILLNEKSYLDSYEQLINCLGKPQIKKNLLVPLHFFMWFKWTVNKKKYFWKIINTYKDKNIFTHSSKSQTAFWVYIFSYTRDFMKKVPAATCALWDR